MNKFEDRLLISGLRKIMVDKVSSRPTTAEKEALKKYCHSKASQLRVMKKGIVNDLYEDLTSWVKKNKLEFSELKIEKLWKRIENRAYNFLRSSKGDVDLIGFQDEIEDFEAIVIDPSDSAFAIQATSNRSSDMRRLSNDITNQLISNIVYQDFQDFCERLKKPGILIECLKAKYEEEELVARWLSYSFPSAECFEALLQSKDQFLESLFLKHGENWQKTIAKEAVKLETAKRLYRKNEEERKKIVIDMYKFYRPYIPNLSKQQIANYFQPALDRLKAKEQTNILDNFLRILWGRRQ